MRDVRLDTLSVNDMLPPGNGGPVFGRGIQCEFTFDESGLDGVSP